VVRGVCAARAPRVAVLPHVPDVVAGFMLPHSLVVMVDAVARGRFALVRSVLEPWHATRRSTASTSGCAHGRP
jgi:hypothetical protein